MNQTNWSGLVYWPRVVTLTRFGAMNQLTPLVGSWPQNVVSVTTFWGHEPNHSIGWFMAPVPRECPTFCFHEPNHSSGWFMAPKCPTLCFEVNHEPTPWSWFMAPYLVKQNVGHFASR